MIDVRKISDSLAQMPDAALQQYAAMHKEDPYTLALAVSESSRRKSMRQAAQAQQAGQPQGSVADEALMEMSPPAGLGAAAPQGFADGGAINSPRLTELLDARARYLNANADTSSLDQAIAFEQDKLQSGLADETARLGARYPAPALDTGDETARLAARYPAPAGLADAADAVLPPAATKTPTPAATAPAAGGAGLSAASRTTGGAPVGPKLDIDPTDIYARQRKDAQGVTDAARAAAQQDLADTEAQQAARGKLGEAREARIKEQQAGLGAKGTQAKKDALLQAGFAILAADPSKGAWSAIGTGALQGLQGYKGDMAGLAKEREALLDKLDELDTLRRQEANADAKDRNALKARIRQVEVEGAKSLAAISGAEAETGVKLKLEAFKELSANWRMSQENAVRLQSARIGASAGGRNSQLEIINALSANPKLLDTYNTMQQGKQRGFDTKSAYADYLKTPGATLSPMTFQQFSAQFGRPELVSAPAGGQVLRGME